MIDPSPTSAASVGPPALSVVIPTRDRAPQLTATLHALTTEIVGDPDLGCEVVVVDDGSAPGHLDSCQSTDWPFPIRWLRLTGNGPATARNRGVEASRGTRVLFLGDDTRPAPGCLRRHLSAPSDGPQAHGLQGHIDWDPERPVSPVMDFLAPAGPQFYFKGLVAGQPIPFTAVLGSNASFPRAWLLAEPYDEGFPAAALEDTEHAHRLAQHGWSTHYDPEALCWHDHPYPEIAPFLGRQRRAGRAARYAVRRRPALLGRVVLQPLVWMPVVVLRRCLATLRGVPPEQRQRLGWDLRCRLAFARGLVGL